MLKNNLVSGCRITISRNSTYCFICFSKSFHNTSPSKISKAALTYKPLVSHNGIQHFHSNPALNKQNEQLLCSSTNCLSTIINNTQIKKNQSVWKAKQSYSICKAIFLFFSKVEKMNKQCHEVNSTRQKLSCELGIKCPTSLLSS